MTVRQSRCVNVARIFAAAVVVALPTVSLADEKPKLPNVRFPFGAEEARKFQNDYATAVGLPKDVTNSAGMKLVLIPSGNFEMGPNGSKYRVTLSKPFYAQSTEVTLGQYRKFRAKHRIEGADAEFNEDDRPASMVSWDDAKAFCTWLSTQEEEKKAGRVYSLPTEAHGNGPFARARPPRVTSERPTRSRRSSPGST
jgi:formylglycine-generating enzyme required for sulfatase activity